MSFSKTWIMGIVAGLIIQYQPLLEGSLPYLTQMAGSLPGPLGMVVAWALPTVFAWGTGALFAWARNQGVETQTVTNPVTGQKSVWKEK